MKTAAHTIQKIDKVSNIVFWTLLAAIVLMMISYIYFINKTVRNVVLRQNLQNEIATLNSNLSDTEFSYINTVGSITLDTAHQLGYVAATQSEKTFVTREVVGENVAMR